MINLQKGERKEIGLKEFMICLGWKENTTGGPDFDLDASAFMLTDNKKIRNEKYFVFYNNLQSPEGGVIHKGDDLIGGDGDCEMIKIDLNKVPEFVKEIIFCVTIYKYDERGQNFGQVRNSFIRAVKITGIDNDGKEILGDEILRYDLDEDFSTENAVEFGRLYRMNDEWKFEAMGIGSKDGLQGFVDRYA